MAARNPASGSSRQDPEAAGEGREAQQAQQAQGSGQVEQYHPSDRSGSARQESRADRQEDERALNARPQGQQSGQGQPGRQSQQSGQSQQSEQRQQSAQGQQSGQDQQSRQTQQSQEGRGTSAGTGVTSDRERQMQTSRETGGQRGLARRQQQQVMSPEEQLSPFSVMRRFLEDTDQLFQAFGFGPTGFGTTGYETLAPYGGRGSSAPARRSFWSPQLEVSRQGNELVVCADLPGLEKNDIDVNVEDGILTIQGERRNESENDREGYYSSERSYGAFYRAVQLPEGVTGEQADATFKNGVLEIRLPIPQEQEQQGRRIEVK